MTTSFRRETVAIVCGALILALVSDAQRVPLGQGGRWLRIVFVQLFGILLPAVAAGYFTNGLDRSTFRIRSIGIGPLAASACLVIAIHPLTSRWSDLVRWLLPLRESIERSPVETSGDQRLGMLLAMIVVAPICEELVFRGFLLSGLSAKRHYWRGILITSLLFSLCHGIPQHALVVLPAGILFAYVSLQTGTIVSSWVMHVVYNALALGLTSWLPHGRARAVLYQVLDVVESRLESWPFLLVAAALAWLLLRWLRLHSPRHAEDR